MTTKQLHQPSRGATLSIGYITVGTLLMIWSGVWYYWIHTTAQPLPPESPQPLICMGFFLSGAALVVIGLLLGRIGQEAKNADIPVGEINAASVTAGGTNGTGAPAAAAPPAAPAAPVPAAPDAAPPQPTAPVPQR